jgi:hypothetical protein
VGLTCFTCSTIILTRGLMNCCAYELLQQSIHLHVHLHSLPLSLSLSSLSLSLPLYLPCCSKASIYMLMRQQPDAISRARMIPSPSPSPSPSSSPSLSLSLSLPPSLTRLQITPVKNICIQVKNVLSGSCNGERLIIKNQEKLLFAIRHSYLRN